MEENQAQQLYNQAHQLWQDNEPDRARKLIDEALTLAPDDMLLHALAMHIKRLAQGPPEPHHAEFILDRDIHFKDPIHTDDCYWFHELLFLTYSMLRGNKSKADRKAEAFAIERRYVQYGYKLLRAGYPVPRLGTLLSYLSTLDRHDEVIGIAEVLAGLRSAQDLGLPGIDQCDVHNDSFDYSDDSICDAYLSTNRVEEGLAWCQTRIDETDAWYYYILKGQLLTRFDRPMDAGKLWIIAIQKGADLEQINRMFETLSCLVADPQAGAKFVLWSRLFDIRKTVPPELAATAKKFSAQTYGAAGNPAKHAPAEIAIEQTLKLKLPAENSGHHSMMHDLWIPCMQGPHPLAKRGKPSVDGIVAYQAKRKPTTIERFGVDLTQLAADGKLPPIVGRDREIDMLVRVLIRMEKNNPVLLGEAGVGKTAIAQGLAQRIVASQVPPFLRGRRVVELTMSALVGGTTWRGDFEERMTQVIHEARDNPDLFLFVDELHTIMGAGATGRGELDAANMVKSALAKGELRLMGATTSQEYSRRISRDMAMARRFTPIRVLEMDRESTLAVLRRRREHWRRFHHVDIADEVIASAVDWVATQLPHRKLPDKAIDLLDETCAHLRTRMKGRAEGPVEMTIDDVRHVLGEWTGGGAESIALSVADDPAEPRDKPAIKLPRRDVIVEQLAQSVVAQPQVVKLLTDFVVDRRLSLYDPKAPTTLLFHGPAVTGKTTAARALAQILWPTDPDRLMILDMAEYADPGALNRLIGAPLGYAQHEEGGLLPAWLKRKPHSVVVWKNLPAAERSVLRLLGNLLRKGVFTDSLGQRVSAASTIFILHLAAGDDRAEIGFAPGGPNRRLPGRDELFDELQSAGIERRLLHCVSQLVSFPALSRDGVLQVLRLHLERLRSAFDRKGIQLEFTAALLDRLADEFARAAADGQAIESLIDRLVTPRVCQQMIDGRAELAGRLVIDW